MNRPVLCLYVLLMTSVLWAFALITGLASYGISEATQRMDEKAECSFSAWYVEAIDVNKNNITVRVQDGEYQDEERVLPYNKYVYRGNTFEVNGGCHAWCFFDRYGHSNYLDKATWGVQKAPRKNSCQWTIFLLSVVLLLMCCIPVFSFTLIYKYSSPHIKAEINKYRAARTFNENIEMDVFDK